MSRSEIFKKAHQIAKSIVAVVGNYSIALSLALKEVYTESNEPKSFIEQVIELGFVEEQYGNYAGYYYLGSIHVKYHNMMDRFEVEDKLFDSEELAQAIAYVKELIKEI